MKNRRLLLALWGLAYSLSTAAFAANTPPIAIPSLVEVTEDQTQTFAVEGLDNDNDPLAYEIFTKPKRGVATLPVGSNQVTYKPMGDYSGPDKLVFEVKDKESKARATVNIMVNAVNDPPVALNQTVPNFKEDTSKTFTLKATDIDSKTLDYLIVTPPVNGTYTKKGAVVTYKPNANYIGTDSFTFKANDGKADSNVAEVKITITAVNDAPEPIEQTITVNPGQVTSITLNGKDVDLTNTEADSDKLIYLLASGRPKTTGTISKPLPTGFGKKAGVRTVEYTPKAGETSDIIWFKVKDANGKLSLVKKVMITVSPNNPPFVFNDASLLSCFSSVPNEATLKALTTFSCDGVDLSTANLTQLENLPNLHTLNLTNAKLTTITGLSGLTNLRNLNLGFNNISNITSLADMTQLQSLRLDFNEINDITALTKLSALQELYLDANKITSIGTGTTSPLAGKSLLTKLALDDNQITDISALSTLLSLTHVGLGYNKISDLTALSGKSLQVLVLDANHLTNLGTLPKPNTLQELYLRGNGPTNSNVLTDVSPLANVLPDLQVLELGFNNISDASPLSTLTKLTRLGLEYNNLANVNALSNVSSLLTLDLEHNQLVSTDGIANLASANGLLRLEHNRLLDDDLAALGVRGSSYHLRVEDNCLSNFPFAKVYGKSWQFQSTHCGSTAPVAISKSVEVLRNTVTTIYLDATDASNNSLNPSDANVSYTLVNTSGVTNGSLSVTGKGEVRFTPNTPTANNTDLGAAGSFTFKVTYNGQASQEATVNLRVVHPLLVACYGAGSIPLESVLAGLSALDCSGKAISDIGILTHYFPALDKLELHNNAITDISSLTQANFPNLTALGLDENPLDTAALMALGSQLPNLKTLSLKKTQLDNADLNILFGNASSPKLQNVDFLILGGNQISSIQPLLHLNKMAILNLDDNVVTDISALSPVAPAALPMPSLAQLSLDKNRLTAVSLPRLSPLTYLQVSNNCLGSAPTVPASTSEVYWATQRPLVNGVCPAYIPPP